jgi:hypothetical protein
MCDKHGCSDDICGVSEVRSLPKFSSCDIWTLGYGFWDSWEAVVFACDDIACSRLLGFRCCSRPFYGLRKADAACVSFVLLHRLVAAVAWSIDRHSLLLGNGPCSHPFAARGSLLHNQ